jgi:hypothetical protein
MDWIFLSTTVGLQDASVFDPPPTCPPIVPPVLYSVSGYVKRFDYFFLIVIVLNLYLASATTNIPIPFANVTIYSNNFTVTNTVTATEDGIYTFNKIDAGPVSIVAQNNSGIMSRLDCTFSKHCLFLFRIFSSRY